MKYFIFCFLIICGIGCHHKESKVDLVKGKMDIPIFLSDIVVSDISDGKFKEMSSYIHVNKYIPLSSEIFLGVIEDVQIVDDYIYILDREPKCSVFDMNGSLRYQIKSQGNGPHDFANIISFYVDNVNHVICFYDSRFQSILKYNSKNGEFISKTKIDMNPYYFVIADGYTFFYTPSYYSVPKQSQYHYSLLVCKDLSVIDKKYFKHDQDLSHYSYSQGKTFFRNDSEIFFVQPFTEDTVYSLFEGVPYPKYKIKLLNPCPVEHWKAHPDPLKVMQSNYTSSLSDVYQVDSMLYFSFSYKGALICSLYDLQKSKMLYCGKYHGPEKPDKRLPFFYPIQGVYNKNFYALVPAYSLKEMQNDNPRLFPKDLTLSEEDNEVLVFFGINRN